MKEREILFFTIICSFWLDCFLSQSLIPVHSYNIIQTFPHDPDAFTEGIFVDPDDPSFFWEGTGLEGKSELRKVVISSGEIVHRYKLSNNHFGEGITQLNGEIYQLTYKSKMVYVYEKKKEFVGDPIILQSLTPYREGWGLTTDGKYLISSDGTPNIFYMDEDLENTDSFQVTQDGKPLIRINELEYINGSIWANVWYSNYIVVIDPESETVSHRIDLKSLKKENPGGVLNGIAYDSKNNKLYVTGKNWANIYQIEIDPPIPNYAPPPSPSPSFPPSPSPISSASCLGLLPIVFVFIQALHLLFM